MFSLNHHRGAHQAPKRRSRLLGLLTASALLQQATAQNCGPGIGSCASGECCSQYGWCGVTSAHCSAGCRANYGTCGGSGPAPSPMIQYPVSTDGSCGPVAQKTCPTSQCCSQYGFCGTTSAYCDTGCQAGWGTCITTSAPLASTAPPASPPSTGAAAVITSCVQPGTVAITFDDGPYLYMDGILDKFDAAGGKVTFFINGNNWRCVYDFAASVRRAADNGHQIGSHTWSHPDLTTLTESAITSQLTQVDAALEKILGYSPTYMRPPFGAYDSHLMTVLRLLNYKANVLWDIDSGDSTGASMAQQQANYNGASTTVPHIFLHHETTQTTADTMVPFIISWVRSRNLRMVTVGECLGDPTGGWYKNYKLREAPNASWAC